MAQVTRVRRLANPSRSRRTKRSNPRKLSLAQKLHFGSKRQRAAAKSALARRRKPKSKAKATTHRVRRANPVRRRRVARRNPALVVTLGALNPHRKVSKVRKVRKVKRSVSSMARTRRRRTRRASNPVRRRRVAVAAPRRRRRRTLRAANPVRRRRVHSRRRRAVNPIRRRRRRNPSAMGHRAFSVDMVKMVGGGLLGVAITKLVASMIPASIKTSMGQFAPVLSAGVAAIVAGMAAQKFVGGALGDGIMFGGLMQTGSAALNAIAPGLKIGDYPVALSGMGDLVEGRFAVPQNPLRPPYGMIQAAAAVPTTARVGVNGLDRAFGRAL
jgi:hypothetical protein